MFLNGVAFSPRPPGAALLLLGTARGALTGASGRDVVPRLRADEAVSRIHRPCGAQENNRFTAAGSMEA